MKKPKLYIIFESFGEGSNALKMLKKNVR